MKYKNCIVGLFLIGTSLAGADIETSVEDAPLNFEVLFSASNLINVGESPDC